jgi:hypothetical protein
MITNYQVKAIGAPQDAGPFRLPADREASLRALLKASRARGSWPERMRAAIEYARGRTEHQNGLGAAAELLYHWRKGEGVTWPT